MQIQNYSISPHFRANINSPKLKFRREDFFVKIRGYGRNLDWASDVRNTADVAVNLIRKNTLFENVMRYIVAGITNANKKTTDISKIEHTGILRTAIDGWRYGSDWDGHLLCTDYTSIKRYQSYESRFDKVAKNPLRNPYKGIDLTVPVIATKEKYLRHGDALYAWNALMKVQKLYDKFSKSFQPSEVTKESLKKITNNIAEIRWILAHSTPWERGNDAISNVFMRAMYKAVGVKTFPLKQGISLDLEAYCTELKDYKAQFHNYFEKAPVVIE